MNKVAQDKEPLGKSLKGNASGNCMHRSSSPEKKISFHRKNGP